MIRVAIVALAGAAVIVALDVVVAAWIGTRPRHRPENCVYQLPELPPFDRCSRCHRRYLEHEFDNSAVWGDR